MATITERGDGWFVQIRKKNFKPQYRTFDLKADAEEWARGVESDMDRALWQDTKKARETMFSDLLLRYAEEVAKHKRSGVSQVYRLKAFAEEPAFQKPVAAVTPADIAEFKNRRLKAGYAAASIRSDLSILSACFKHARKEWHIPLLRNPAGADEVARPPLPPENSRTRTGTDAETNEILSHSSSSFLPQFVWLLLELACRRSDLCRLRWECVDLDADEPTALFKADLTKNENARTVPLSPKAVRLFKTLPTPHCGPVFKSTEWRRTDDDGGENAPPLPADSVTQAWIRARGRAAAKNPALATLRLHDHRHTSVTRLVQDTNLGHLEVAAISGHKDLRSLKRYYNEDGKKLSRKLGWSKNERPAAPRAERAAAEAASVPTIRVRKDGSRFVAYAQTPEGGMEAEGDSAKEAKELLLELL